MCRCGKQQGERQAAQRQGNGSSFSPFFPSWGGAGTFRTRLLPSVNPLRKHAHREPRVCFARLDIHHVNNQLGFVRRQTPWAFSDFPNHTVRLWRSRVKLCVLQPPRQTNSMIVVVFCLQCKGMNPAKALGLRDRCSTPEL